MTDVAAPVEPAGSAGPAGPADPVNSTAEAYETLRQAIINADLAPGQIVSQVQLAAELNVSRTPLREALRRLQSEGLLEGDFNRRLRVAPLTVSDLEQVAAMRIMLESLCVQTSVPVLTDTDLACAAEAFDAMDAVWATTGSFHEFTAHHRRFHTTLFSASGERLRAQLEELWDHAERYRAIYRTTANDRMTLTTIAHDEHEAILTAARERDADRCGQLIASHLARTALAAIATLEPTYDPKMIRRATTLASG
jgi:DNA-binding GntR family transcriptional regulator